MTVEANGQTFVDTIHIALPGLQLVSTPLTSCTNTHGNYSVGLIQSDVKYSWTVTNGLPASATALSNIDIYWNQGDTTGVIKIVAIDTVTGCADSIITPVSIAISDSGFVHLGPADSITSCNGVSVPLTVQSSSANSYSWYLNDTIIAGYDSSIYSASLPGAYYVITIASAGCRKKSNPVNIHITDSVSLYLTPAGNITSCPGGNSIIYSSTISSFSLQLVFE